MGLDRYIKNRRSVRKYKDLKPDWRDIIESIDSCRYGPMAGNIYTLKFILVDDPRIIMKLAEAAQQTFVSHAQFVVVVCTKPLRTINAYGERGKRYCRQQAGAAIENFLLKIQEIGLSTCWVGAFADELVKEALKIPDDVDVEAMFPIGYEYSKPRTRKNKVDIDRILYFNKYGKKKMRDIKTLDV